MSDETVSVVVCHEGTPSNTYTVHETDLQLVMEAIGAAISWRSMEDKVEAALKKFAAAWPCPFEKHRGRVVGWNHLVVRIDKTVEQDIVITLEGDTVVMVDGRPPVREYL